MCDLFPLSLKGLLNGIPAVVSESLRLAQWLKSRPQFGGHGDRVPNNTLFCKKVVVSAGPRITLQFLFLCPALRRIDGSAAPLRRVVVTHTQ